MSDDPDGGRGELDPPRGRDRRERRPLPVFWLVVPVLWVLGLCACEDAPVPGSFAAQCEARCPGGVVEIVTPKLPKDVCFCWTLASSTEVLTDGRLEPRIARCDSVCEEGKLAAYGVLPFFCQCDLPP